MSIDLREKGRGREGETSMWERNIHRLPPVTASMGIKPATFLVYGMALWPAEPPGQNPIFFVFKNNMAMNIFMYILTLRAVVSQEYKLRSRVTCWTLQDNANCTLAGAVSGLSAGLQTERSIVRFPVRAHAWVVGPVPGWEWATGNASLFLLHISVSPPLPPFLLLSLKINKIL